MSSLSVSGLGGRVTSSVFFCFGASRGSKPSWVQRWLTVWSLLSNLLQDPFSPEVFPERSELELISIFTYPTYSIFSHVWPSIPENQTNHLFFPNSINFPSFMSMSLLWQQPYRNTPENYTELLNHSPAFCILSVSLGHECSLVCMTNLNNVLQTHITKRWAIFLIINKRSRTQS